MAWREACTLNSTLSPSPLLMRLVYIISAWTSFLLSPSPSFTSCVENTSFFYVKSLSLSLFPPLLFAAVFSLLVIVGSQLEWLSRRQRDERANDEILCISSHVWKLYVKVCMCLGLEQTSTSSSGELEERCEICTAASSSCLFAESSKLSLQHCAQSLKAT